MHNAVCSGSRRLRGLAYCRADGTRRSVEHAPQTSGHAQRARGLFVVAGGQSAVPQAQVPVQAQVFVQFAVWHVAVSSHSGICDVGQRVRGIVIAPPAIMPVSCAVNTRSVCFDNVIFFIGFSSVRVESRSHGGMPAGRASPHGTKKLREDTPES